MNTRPTPHKSKPLHCVDETDSSDSVEWVNAIHKQQHSKTSADVKCEMLVGSNSVTFQVDPGASVNILPVRFAPHVTPTNKTLTMWNGNRYVAYH